jgi:hypothetical protein
MLSHFLKSTITTLIRLVQITFDSSPFSNGRPAQAIVQRILLSDASSYVRNFDIPFLLAWLFLYGISSSLNIYIL